MSAATTTGDRCFYITAFSDEIMPCAPTLEAWADWLSKPDAEWGRPTPAEHGAVFDASVLSFQDDIIATRTESGWAFSRDPAGVDFLAVRFAAGLGWDADAVIFGQDMGKALRDWLIENDAFCEDEEHVAVAMNDAPVRLTFQPEPKPTLTVEVIQ